MVGVGERRVLAQQKSNGNDKPKAGDFLVAAMNCDDV